jgi:hypothetical protein
MEASATPGSTSQGNEAKAQATGTEIGNGKEPTGSANKGDVQAGNNSPGEGTLKAAAKEALKRIKLGAVEADVPEAVADSIKNLERGFQSKYQQIAKERSELAKQIEAFKRDPDSFMRNQGIDPDQYAQEKIAKKLEWELMSEEQKEIAQYKHELAKYKEDEAAKQRMAESENLTKEEAKFALQMRQEMMGAWESSGLPADQRFGQWIAATMMAANQQELGWTWEDCAVKVKEDWISHARETAQALGPERLHELLGDELLHKWREHDLKRVTGKAAAQVKKPSPDVSSASPKKKIMNERDWSKAWDRL